MIVCMVEKLLPYTAAVVASLFATTERAAFTKKNTNIVQKRLKARKATIGCPSTADKVRNVEKKIIII